MTTRDQLETILKSIIQPRTRVRAGGISKEQLLEIFIDSDHPDVLTLSHVVAAYCKLLKCESTSDLVRSIAKSLRDIDIWIDDAAQKGLVDVDLRFHVNQAELPLLTMASSETPSIAETRFLEVLPSAIEKVFQPKFPETISNEKLPKKFQWLEAIFSSHLLLDAPAPTLAILARTVSLISLSRIRDILSQSLGNGRTVFAIRNPFMAKPPARIQQELYITTVLAEAYHNALFDASPHVDVIGSIKHIVIVPKSEYKRFLKSAAMTELRMLRSRGQLVYLKDCESGDAYSELDLSIAVESSTFVQFPLDGCPDALVVDRGPNSIGPSNRHILNELQSQIASGDLQAVDASVYSKSSQPSIL